MGQSRQWKHDSSFIYLGYALKSVVRLLQRLSSSDGIPNIYSHCHCCEGSKTRERTPKLFTKLETAPLKNSAGALDCIVRRDIFKTRLVFFDTLQYGVHCIGLVVTRFALRIHASIICMRFLFISFLLSLVVHGQFK